MNFNPFSVYNALKSQLTGLPPPKKDTVRHRPDHKMDGRFTFTFY